MQTVRGIHHVTAIAGDAQENLDFYVGVLGMRLVKRTINQDAPDTYHLFYADRDGNPGTGLTFFPWPKLPPRRPGWGLWDELYLGVPARSLTYWHERLQSKGVNCQEPEVRFGESVLPVEDPHGLRLALVESETYAEFSSTPWEASPVPREYQVHSLAGVRVLVREHEASAEFFARALGFQPDPNEVQSAGSGECELRRYVVGEGKAGQRIDLCVSPEVARGALGVGAIHHVAWRAADEHEQAHLSQAVRSAGGSPTPTIDRFWFKSVYVREPGGALNEIATDGPGFAVDESPDKLGERLVLPPCFETSREAIEAALPALSVPRFEPG